MSALRSIVYVSTAVRVMTEADLESLLTEARDLNLESRVTGVLLYSDGTFMQCFEGPEPGMTKTYERIRGSRRHTGIIELVDEPVAARGFQDWEMGFRRASASDLLLLSTARWQRQAHAAAPATESAGMHLLKHFWAQAPR